MALVRSAAPVRVHGVDEGRVEMQFGEHVLDDRQRGRVGAFGRVAAAQQGRVAGFDAQRHHVHGNVGACLIDHADHTHRHAHLLQAQAVGGFEPAHNLPHRVGQHGHMAHVLRRGRDAWHVEFEPVELACVHAFVERLAHVERVRRGDLVSARVERVGDRRKQPVLHVGRGFRQGALRLRGAVGHRAHRFEHAARHLIRLFHRCSRHICEDSG